MGDKELLELAAKAAGYWSEEFKCVDKLPHLGWDPRANYGDALRLAHSLRMHIEPITTMGGRPAGWSVWPAGRGDCAAVEDGTGVDALCLAIVKAAAALGREPGGRNG